MIQYTDSKLIVSITTATPLEQLITLKRSLHRVLEHVNCDDVESNSGLIYDMQNVMSFASQLEFEDEQIRQITLALKVHNPEQEHLLTA